MCQLKTLLKDFTSIPANTPGETKGRVTHMSGQRALKVSDARTRRTCTSPTRTAEAAAAHRPERDRRQLSFGYPGTAVAISPPPASEILVGGQ